MKSAPSHFSLQNSVRGNLAPRVPSLPAVAVEQALAVELPAFAPLVWVQVRSPCDEEAGWVAFLLAFSLHAFEKCGLGLEQVI